MSKTAQADFYFGAILSVLLNKKYTPVLLEGNEDRQIYSITTNKEEDFILYLKYRSAPLTYTNDYKSWQFMFTQDEINFFSDNFSKSNNLKIALLCGARELNKSEIVVINTNEIQSIIFNGDSIKYSITIGREKHARNFRISRGGGRDNDLLIPANRF
ncbi:MAG: hypothetical protein PHY90_01975 [Desulfitobacteriaceae bacterium]|nr:hypothetical protein [Desulfitobacteriaceae bacterium]